MKWKRLKGKIVSFMLIFALLITGANLPAGSADAQTADTTSDVEKLVFEFTAAGEYDGHNGLTNDKKVFYCGFDSEYKTLFQSMIKELQMCQDGYPEMLEMYLRQIFIKLQRDFHSSITITSSRTAAEIDGAVSYFSEHYNEQINIDDYAKQNFVSTSWLIRNFRLYTGITPKQFIMKKRIYNAEILLQNQHYSINEIARIVGYDNPLYFSRIFQKTKGISPSEYRKNA